MPMLELCSLYRTTQTLDSVVAKVGPGDAQLASRDSVCLRAKQSERREENEQSRQVESRRPCGERRGLAGCPAREPAFVCLANTFTSDAATLEAKVSLGSQFTKSLQTKSAKRALENNSRR
ncbi:hypothetical protein L1887_47943 [Cichorium endivia]|nr:hypothetical protein L1887_47943 [Cichorium endivia]